MTVNAKTAGVGQDFLVSAKSVDQKMPQPIDMSPPWWDGTISINFTTDEWMGIVKELKMLYQIPEFPENDYDAMIVNIIDRIEKNIGLE